MTLFQHGVDERRLAVVDMGNNSYIPDVFSFHSFVSPAFSICNSKKFTPYYSKRGAMKKGDAAEISLFSDDFRRFLRFAPAFPRPRLINL
jgi:hypothetical protein